MRNRPEQLELFDLAEFQARPAPPVPQGKIDGLIEGLADMAEELRRETRQLQLEAQKLGAAGPKMRKAGYSPPERDAGEI